MGAAGRPWTGVALNGREVLFSSDTQGGSAVRGHKGELSLVFVGVTVEERDDNDKKDLVGRGAGVVGRRPKGAKTVPQEADNGHMLGANGEVPVDMIAGILRLPTLP